MVETVSNCHETFCTKRNVAMCSFIMRDVYNMVATVSNCHETFRTKRAKTNVAMCSFIMRDVRVCIYFRDTSFAFHFLLVASAST